MTEMDKYARYLKRNEMAQNTISVYVYTAKTFLDMRKKLDYTQLQAWKCDLIDRYKPNTVNLRIRAMNKYLSYKGLDKMKLKGIRVQHKPFLENVISNADYKKLCDGLREAGKMTLYYAARFMACTGARVSELIKFTVGDVYAGYMDILAKGNKVRRIYIPKRLQKDAIGWLGADKNAEERIFKNSSGKTITPRSLAGQLKAMAEKLSIRKDTVYPHSFRHRFAKNFLAKHSDITLLADLLGHENLETTRIYLRKSSSEQRLLIDKLVDW